MSLEHLQPDEILLNEGQKNSVLAQKIFMYYSHKHAVESEEAQKASTAQSPSNLAPPTTTVVKFISRGNFDQTKGAELLEKVALPRTYKPEILSEFIIPSSANAVLSYTQTHIGAVFSPRTLPISLTTSESSRMTIDRSSIMNLEVSRGVRVERTGLLNNTLLSPPCAAAREREELQVEAVALHVD